MNEWSHEDMLAAARAIRPYLVELSPDHKQRDAQIASLLVTTDEDVELALVDALTATNILRDWTEQFLRQRKPPQLVRTRSGLNLTISNPVNFERWVCPQGDFDWFRFQADERIRPCPTHGIHLVLAAASGSKS